VDGHPLLVEQLVAQAGRSDLDELLEEVAKRQGDFAARLEIVYAWSAARLDETGLAAWASLPLFPAGSAPEGVLRGPGGAQKLRETALADFYPSEQLWRWHATVAEYARGQWPLSGEEQRSRMIALLPAWTKWLKRQPIGKRVTLNRLEASRFNLDAILEVCSSASYEDAWVFLDELDTRLPSPERTLTLRELAAKALEGKLLVIPADDRVRRAGLLHNLGGALSALGRREEALEAAQEAVEVYRKLAEANPQAFLPNLAMSLNNLGNGLSALGRREQALETAQEAVDIRRKLAEANPQAFLPNLAMSLGTYGSVLLALDRHSEASLAFAEGLQHLAPFYQDLPQAFTGLVNALRRYYLEASRKAGQEPDKDLLSQFD
jgi:tetratricopeptide (TPR) repeat protein